MSSDKGQLIVISAPSGAGKTSIINELKKRGFFCVNESAREIINHERKSGGQALPWKNQISFENQLSDIRTEKYFSVTKNQLCFLYMFCTCIINGYQCGSRRVFAHKNFQFSRRRIVTLISAENCKQRNQWICSRVV